MREKMLTESKQNFEDPSFGDRRRTQRLVHLSADLATHTGSSLATATLGPTHAATEGAYRLIRNPNVTAQALLESGFQSTVVCVENYTSDDEILAIQDSNTLGYEHSVRDELGDLGGPANSTTRK